MATPSHRDLNINERINLKALLAAWTRITIERFQGDIDAKVYATGRKGGKKARPIKRSGRLKTAWYSQNRVASPGSGMSTIQIAFSLYGRFVDMGVGRGMGIGEATYRRNRKNGEPITGKPKKWCSRRKGFETYRLAQLLKRYRINLPIGLVENALTTAVPISL